MSDNVAALGRYYDEAWNRGDLAVLDELVSRDLVGHDPFIGDFGFPVLRETLVAFRAAIPDLRVTARDVVAQGDRVALRFRSEGTFTGELMGWAPTGRPVCITGLVMYRFSAGRIAEIWVEWDHHRFRQQIGALPAGVRA